MPSVPCVYIPPGGPGVAADCGRQPVTHASLAWAVPGTLKGMTRYGLASSCRGSGGGGQVPRLQWSCGWGTGREMWRNAAPQAPLQGEYRPDWADCTVSRPAEVLPTCDAVCLPVIALISTLVYVHPLSHNR
eukprot:gene7485-biopygen9087